MMTVIYLGTECHKNALRAIHVVTEVVGITADSEVEAGGVWTINGFPTTVNDLCRLGRRGVYVAAPGGMTEQFLSPTSDSVVRVTYYMDGVQPVHEERSAPIDLDPDNPDGDE
jgi:hypothetical protein